MLGELMTEADPVALARAICIVYDRRDQQNRKPNSDTILHSTRRHRPELVAEVVAEWERIVGADSDDDAFPYHESYVVRKWIQFRKQNDAVKAAMIAAAKRDE